MKTTAQIFLSYARLDEEKVEKLYQKLSDAGFKPWMDKKDVLPGERWESCIQKAIQRSDFFLACLSANSVNRRGFLQREIKDALHIWQKMLEDDIFLIPVRLEDCEVPENLREFQWVDLFEEDGWTRLVKAIQVGMERRAEVLGVEKPYPGTERTTPEEGPEWVFDEQIWRQNLSVHLRNLRSRWEQAQTFGVRTLYAFLAALVLKPLVEAMQQGDATQVSLTLRRVTAGVGHHLLTSQLQGWSDGIKAAQSIEAQGPDSDELREAIDSIFSELDVVVMAQSLLDDDDRAWFVKQLWRGLSQADEFYRTRASLGDILISGSGAVATSGGVAGGTGAIVAGRDVHIHLESKTVTAQPPVSHLPWPPTLPWNEPYYHLPDRDQAIVEVVQDLTERAQPQVVFISGLGGLGKTAAAIEIGRRCLANGAFERVLGDSAKQEVLIDGRVAQATDRAVLNFDNLLDELGTQMDRPDIRTMSLEEKRLTVQRLLHQSPYLVVVDNLETAENAAQIVRDLPHLLNGSRALITSRQLIRQGDLHLLQLEGLTEKDSLIFLREDARQRGCIEIINAPDETLLEIHEATGGQPLAMKLVVGQSLDVDLSFVLKSLRQARGEIYHFIYLDSWRWLSPPAKNLLIYLGRVPASISLEELFDVPIGAEPDDLLAGMQELIRLSLVNVIQGAGKKRYTIHQLTRHFVNSELPKLWQEESLHGA